VLSLKKTPPTVPGASAEEIAAHFNLLPDRYFTQTPESDVARHIGMVNRLLHTISGADSLGSLRPVIEWQDDVARGLSAAHVVTWDRAGLFYKLAGALSVAGLNIFSAKVTTRNDHIAIDTFEVSAPDGGPVRDSATHQVFARAVEDELVANKDLGPLIAEKAREMAPLPRSPLPPSVEVYLEVASPRVIVEIHAPDRFGLLYRVGRVMTEHGFSLTAARVNTERGLAIDSFHLEPADRRAVDATRLIRLREVLLGTVSATVA
jgi:[protein-PII] uridylyltransferase